MKNDIFVVKILTKQFVSEISEICKGRSLRILLSLHRLSVGLSEKLCKTTFVVTGVENMIVSPIDNLKYYNEDCVSRRFGFCM